MMKQILVSLMVVMCAAGVARAVDSYFSGAVDDNWAVAGNWDPQPPNPDPGMAQIGDPNYGNQSATVYTASAVTTFAAHAAENPSSNPPTLLFLATNDE